MPDMRWVIQENRAFLRRAVRFIAEPASTSSSTSVPGIPTVGNVHEVVAVGQSARRGWSTSTTTRSRWRTAARSCDGNPNTAVVAGRSAQAGRSAGAIPERARLVDLDRPVGVLLNAVLHFVPDDDEARAIVG